MKNILSSLPTDVKQAAASLAVAVALLCASLFMLSAYMESIKPEGNDAPVAATLPEESTTASD